MKTKLLNIALYQGGWFACVFGAADGYPWLGALAAFVLICVHTALTPNRRAEWILILVVGIFGTVVDSSLMAIGIFEYDAGQWVSWLCPAWMSVMWMQFATLVRYSISWLSGNYLLGSILGAFGGPIAYISGVNLGAASFGVSNTTALASLAVVWAIVIPFLFMVESQLRPEGMEPVYRI